MFRSTLEKMIDVRDLKRAEREDGDAGFTLIELLVVVVIIGILIAIAIPLYLNYTKGAKEKGTESDVRAAVAAVQQCYTDNNNEFPAASTGGTDGDDLTFACPDADNEQTVKLSDGTTSLAYDFVDADSYTLTGTASDGKVYEYDSSVGKVELQPAG